MNRGRCNICGQLITDASGCWMLFARDHGINHMPEERLQVCGWCKSGIDDALKELSQQRREERKKWEV